MEEQSIKKEFTLGVFFIAISKYAGVLLLIVITAILARLLSPNDFGVVAIATVIIQFFSALYEAGLSTAIIQNKSFTRRDYDSIFTFSTLIGIVLAVIFVSSSDFIAQYYEDEKLSGICKWLSVIVVIGAMNVAPNAILLKEKKFKALSVRAIVAQIISGLISVYMAYVGYGLYALVASVIVSNFLIFLFSYLYYPLKLNFNFNCLKEVIFYSFFQFLSNLIAYLGRNLDKLIIGKYIGMTQLGYYEKSYKLMMMPLQNITYVITPVLHPIFSNFQNNWDSIITRYKKLLKILSYIGFPLSIFLFYSASELILVFFGNQWVDSIYTFKILSLTAGVQILNSTCGSIFQSIGYTKGLFICSFTSFIFMTLGLYVASAYFGSIEAIAYAFDITLIIGVVIVFSVLFKKLRISLKEFVVLMSGPSILSIILFAIMTAYESLVIIDNNVVSAIIKFVIIFIVTISYMLYTKVLMFSDIKKVYLKVRRR